MVEGAGELKLDMGVLQGGLVGPCPAWAQHNNAFHTEKVIENVERNGEWEWKMEMAYLTLPW